MSKQHESKKVNNGKGEVKMDKENKTIKISKIKEGEIDTDKLIETSKKLSAKTEENNIIEKPTKNLEKVMKELGITEEDLNDPELEKLTLEEKVRLYKIYKVLDNFPTILDDNKTTEEEKLKVLKDNKKYFRSLFENRIETIDEYCKLVKEYTWLLLTKDKITDDDCKFIENLVEEGKLPQDEITDIYKDTLKETLFAVIDNELNKTLTLTNKIKLEQELEKITPKINGILFPIDVFDELKRLEEENPDFHETFRLIKEKLNEAKLNLKVYEKLDPYFPILSQYEIQMRLIYMDETGLLNHVGMANILNSIYDKLTEEYKNNEEVKKFFSYYHIGNNEEESLEEA